VAAHRPRGCPRPGRTPHRLAALLPRRHLARPLRHHRHPWHGPRPGRGPHRVRSLAPRNRPGQRRGHGPGRAGRARTRRGDPAHGHPRPPDQAAADLADIPGVSLEQALADAQAASRDARLAPDPARLLLGPLLGPASNGFGIDRLYRLWIVRPFLGAAQLVRFLDREVIETYIAGATGAPRLLGAAVRRAQNGNAQAYVSALLAGAVVLAVLVETTR
jgi:hypothetical protein